MITKKCKICGTLFICYTQVTEKERTLCCQCIVKKQIGEIIEDLDSQETFDLNKEVEIVQNEMMKILENKEKE